MSISVGLGDTQTGRLLRLTLSGEDRLRAIQEWRGERVRWALTAEHGQRYRLVFYAGTGGVVGRDVSLPRGRDMETYHTHTWNNRRLPADMALLREHGSQGELAIWEGDKLIVEVRKTQLKRRRCSCATQEHRVIEKVGAISRETIDITPVTPKERENAMRTEAIYHLSKETSGSLAYTPDEGDLSLGTLYIRKEGPLAKGKHKRIRVSVEAL